MEKKNREIPEELFQKEFGGGEIRSLMQARNRQKQSERALWVMVGMYVVPGLVFLLIAVIVMMHFSGTAGPGFRI